MVDESSDVACTKHLCICIKYFNSGSNEITSQFLGLIPVINTNADAVYEHVKAFFDESGIDLKLLWSWHRWYFQFVWLQSLIVYFDEKGPK